MGEARQHGGVGDLVAVEMQDGQDRAVVHRVEELVRVPGGGERPRLGLPVTDHAGGQQLRVVERRAIGVREGIAQLTALVEGPGDLGRGMARHPAGEGELPEEPGHPRGVPAEVRVHIAVRTVQPGARQHGRPAVPGPPHADRVEVASADHPVEVGVDEVEAGAGAPVPQQPRLDVLGLQLLAEQRVPGEIQLAGGQVVEGAPVCQQLVEFVRVERCTRLHEQPFVGYGRL